MADNKYTAIGIDVSSWKKEINWEKVKPHIDFAILRCGFGNSGVDSRFEYNWKECERLGIPYGVYYYSYASNVGEAITEANNCLNIIKDCKLSYPIYYDLEDISLPGNATELITIAENFGDIIENAGYWCGVYSSCSWWQGKLKNLTRFTKWVAHWADKCEYAERHDMWQFSDKGKIEGISGDVDMNLCYLDFSKYIDGPKIDPRDEFIKELRSLMNKYGY